MGTKTLGDTSVPGGGTFYFTPNNDAAKAYYASYLTAPEDLYIDSIVVYCGSHNGGSSTFRFGVYTTGGTLLGAETPSASYGTGYGWNSGTFAAGNYVFLSSGYGFVGALLAAGQALQVKGRGNGGQFEWWNAGSAVDLPSSWSPTGQVTSVGDLAWYITYFPKAAITSIPSTPVAVGASFTVSGKSFSAGVTGVTINGVACPTYSVVDDATLSVTVPAGATTGPVQVTTNAGTATSATNLQVGSIYTDNGASWVSGLIVSADDGANWQQCTVFVDDGANWQQIG